MNTAPLILVFLVGMVVHAQASVIESMGVNTVEDARAALEPSDYKLNLRDGLRLEDAEEGFVARILDLQQSPALGLKDVQVQVADATIQPGSRFLRHFHPRSAEVVYQRRGRLEFTIEFENGSVAVNVLRRGDILVIPQGLIHEARCLTPRRPCSFIATFRTADPGLVPLPFRE